MPSASSQIWAVDAAAPRRSRSSRTASSSSVSATSSRTIAASGALGTASAPIGRQPPTSTVASSARAICASSVTSRVLPIPASPATSSTPAPRSRERWSAATRRLSSSLLPIRRGLIIRAISLEFFQWTRFQGYLDHRGASVVVLGGLLRLGVPMSVID